MQGGGAPAAWGGASRQRMTTGRLAWAQDHLPPFQGWQATSGPAGETSESPMQPGEPDENDALRGPAAAGQAGPGRRVVGGDFGGCRWPSGGLGLSSSFLPFPGQPCSFPMAVYKPRPLHSQAPLFLNGVPIVARVDSTERYTWGSKVSGGPWTLYRHLPVSLDPPAAPLQDRPQAQSPALPQRSLFDQPLPSAREPGPLPLAPSSSAGRS